MCSEEDAAIMRDQPARPVTEKESQTLLRDGAVLIKGVLSDKWVDQLARGLDDAIHVTDTMTHDLSPELRTGQFPYKHSAGLRRIVEESPVAEIAGRAAQTSVRFYMDQLFYKPKGHIPPTPWHQDTCYYNVEGHQLIRTWVSPDPVPREASIEIVRGSHLWNITYRALAGRDPDIDPEARAQQKNQPAGVPMLGVDAFEAWDYFSGVRDNSAPLVPQIEGRRDSYDIIGWDYEPGDVLVFYAHALHGACGDVESPIGRRAHALLWSGEDVRYKHRPGQIIPDPAPLYAHEPKTGQLLSEFSDVFPTAWAP
jgi:ectoine hydroxylase-related dioxygenase (phytanoyl-CoA dioxygenase family)